MADNDLPRGVFPGRSALTRRTSTGDPSITDMRPIMGYDPNNRTLGYFLYPSKDQWISGFGSCGIHQNVAGRWMRFGPGLTPVVHHRALPIDVSKYAENGVVQVKNYALMMQLPDDTLKATAIEQDLKDVAQDAFFCKTEDNWVTILTPERQEAADLIALMQDAIDGVVLMDGSGRAY